MAGDSGNTQTELLEKTWSQIKEDNRKKQIDERNKLFDLRNKEFTNPHGLFSKLLKDLEAGRYTDVDKDGKRQFRMDKFIQDAEHELSAQVNAYNSAWDSSMRVLVGLAKSYAEALSPTVAFYLGQLSLPVANGLLQCIDWSVTGVRNSATRLGGFFDGIFGQKAPLETPELYYELNVTTDGCVEVELSSKDGSAIEHEEEWKGFFKQAVDLFLRNKGWDVNPDTRCCLNESHPLQDSDMEELSDEFKGFINISSFEKKPSDSPVPRF